MYLTDARAIRYATLKSLNVDNLSRQVTVIHGPASCGKSTFVRFLRGMLFGFRSSEADLQAGMDSAGELRVTDRHGVFTLRRHRGAGGMEDFAVSVESGAATSTRQTNRLPVWVSESVFREVFSVGHEEAYRFDLLVRLCLEESGVSVSAAELTQAELALEQVIRERDGNGVHGGVVHRISELRRRQGELQTEIAQLRRPSVNQNLKLRQLQDEIETLTATLSRIDLKLSDLTAEVSRLTVLIEQLRRQNVVPLNRDHIEESISKLRRRLERWREIRRSIGSLSQPSGTDNANTPQPLNSLASLRALVTRLEHRTDTLSGNRTAVGSAMMIGEPAGDHLSGLRDELAGLCQYLGQHELAMSRHLRDLEFQAARMILDHVTQMEHLLDEQLRSLQAELDRADNVLAGSVRQALWHDCQFSGHVISGETRAGNDGVKSLSELESRLSLLRAEQERLRSERVAAERSREHAKMLLERLMQEVSGTATLEQLDTLRAGIAELDAEITLLEDQRRQLDRTESSLREVMSRLKTAGPSPILELASRYIERMTDGECCGFSIEASEQLMIRRRNGEMLSTAQLSRGTRDQVALAIRLAIIRCRSEVSGHVPLILDDVFITTDDARAASTVRLLMELADDGQQIIFLTCQTEVRDLFARFGAECRFFGEYRPKDVPVPVAAEPQPPVFIEPEAGVSSTVEVVVPQVQMLSIAPESSAALTPTNWLFYLEVDHGVEELAGITLGELEALRATGLLTIDDLLHHSVPQLEEAVRLKGFLMCVDRLAALRGQAELTTRVPMLRRSDAALLYAAGIRSAEELSRLRPETVYDRVAGFQRSEQGVRFRRGGRLIDRQQAINWARFGQFTRSLEEARGSRSRFSTRAAGAASATLPAVGSRLRATGSTRDDERVHRRHKRRGTDEDQDRDERRQRRITRRRRQVAHLRARTPVVSDEQNIPAERSGGMRFYLNRQSEIERAPSIGPRTAEMMGAVGVRTVNDFLSLEAERLAELLNHRRITPAVIRQWQTQSRLMCQIPELRGHDAQILVACNITSPETLAAQNPAELFALVEPFANSKEGERIIRQGRKPDLAEVTEWIQWAANARSLRAA